MKEGQSEMVRIYDPETKETTLIPASELAAGMARIQIQGVTGEVWVDAAKLKVTSVERHARLAEELQKKIRFIERSLREVYPMTYEEWEEGFRCDRDVEQEIESWVHLCRCYNDFIAWNFSPLEERKQAFAMLGACIIGTQTTALEISPRKMPDQEKARQLIEAFFQGY